MKTFAVILLLEILVHAATARELPENEAAALEQRFLSAQRNTRTLRADFRQIVTAPGLRDAAVSEGRLLYRAPDDLLVIYTKPAGDYLLLRGETFTSSRAGNLTTRNASHSSARALTALRDVLLGTPPDSPMKRDVSIGSGEYTVTLVPSNAGPNQPERIENVLDASNLQWQSMTITLPRGATMQFQFSLVRRNAAIDTKAFDLP